MSTETTIIKETENKNENENNSLMDVLDTEIVVDNPKVDEGDVSEIKDVSLDNDVKPLIDLENPPEESYVRLRLGDIISIVAPQSEILNGQVFLIYYIDKTKIKLFNVETDTTTQIAIDKEGIVGDGLIDEIRVLSVNKLKGYALQNDLVVGTWINIYFVGDIANSLSGHITNLENDMIEVKLTNDDVIYINFNYQGLPEDLFIKGIEIIPAPNLNKSPEQAPDNGMDMDLNMDMDGVSDEIVYVPETKPPEIEIVEDAEIELGEDVVFYKNIELRKEHYVYNLETQTNDMLETILATIPPNKRTDTVLNNIHTTIQRFIQLRRMSSKFDNHNNVIGIKRVTANDKPLANYLSELKNKLYWIAFVGKNVKKIYSENGVDNALLEKDIVMFNDNDVLVELKQIFNRYQQSSVTIEDHNKYTELFQNLDPLFVPFENMNSENNGIITEGLVEDNIDVIMDNIYDGKNTFMSDAITNKDIIKPKRFMVQRYNTGIDNLFSQNLKGSKLIANRVKMTDNDKLAIKSIMTFPEPVVRFAKINLPNTNILMRSNLNLHFFSYWRVLTSKTNVNDVDIASLNNAINYSEDNFINNIKNYSLNLQNQYEELDENTYAKYLDIVVPKIKILFNMVKKYITGRLSFTHIIDYLEPFMIYSKDITFTQYREISKFINEKIKEMVIKTNALGREMGIIRTKKFNNVYKNLSLWNLTDLYRENNDKYQRIRSEVFKIYDKIGKDITVGYYENNKSLKISASEGLKMIYDLDYGRVFTSGIAYENIHLMFPTQITSILNADKATIENAMETNAANNKCKSHIITKKYYSKEGLEIDNNTVIYYDPEYDTTNYNVINENDKYRKAFYEKSPEDFFNYITLEIKTKQKLSDDDAVEVATTLIERRKKVQNGNYAILIRHSGDNPETMTYYIRQDDQWVLDDTVDEKLFIKSDDILCNMQTDCMYDVKTSKCETDDMNKDKIMNDAIKQIMDEFDKNYDVSKTNLHAKLLAQYQYNTSVIPKIKEMQSFKEVHLDIEKLLIGEKPEPPTVVSPYTKLRDLILGQSDFVKRQRDTLKFCQKFTFNGDITAFNSVENAPYSEWWMYCKQTDTKLIPTFRYMLAQQFIENPSNYNNEIMRLIKLIGVKDENDNFWRDKNSGEVITEIDFDIDEGYTESGFKNTSRRIIEEDNITLEPQEQALSEEGQQIANVIYALTTNMGINIDNSYEFIIKAVSEIINDESKFPKEEKYMKRQEAKLAKGDIKKMKSFATEYDDRIITVTLGVLLVAMQTSIPPVKTRKTFPNCVRSFSGFPLEGEGNNDGLDYLACVVSKMSTKVRPWTSLSRKKETQIAEIIKKVIVSYVLPYPPIEMKMKSKAEYLLSNPERVIPVEHSLQKWTGFLPPLIRFNITHLSSLDDGFLDRLNEKMAQGNSSQLEDLLVVRSKCIYFSLAIQEEIQKIIDKKDTLLKASNSAIVTNSCCNERRTGGVIPTTLQYFISESNLIEQYNTVVMNLTAYLHNIRLIMTGTSMLSKVNTRRPPAEIGTKYSEITIYQGFIQLCHFQSNLPLSDSLIRICKEKPKFLLRKTDSIQDKIAILKQDGRDYTAARFMRLLQISAYNNIIRNPTRFDDVLYIDGMIKTLKAIDDTNDQNVAIRELCSRMDCFVDFETGQDITKKCNKEEPQTDLIKYLETGIRNMRQTLLSFLKTYAKQSSFCSYKKSEKFIKTFTNWMAEDRPRNPNERISDDTMYVYIQYYKNMIHLLGRIFPEIILNKTVMSIIPPTYWKLSGNHNRDLVEYVEEYYKFLTPFYSNELLVNVLKKVQRNTENIIRLSDATYGTTEIKIGDEILVNNVFNKDLIKLLYEYYILQIFEEYVNLSDDIKMFNYPADEDKIAGVDDEEEEEDEEGDIDYEQIIGKKNLLKLKIGELLCVFIKFANDTKDVINVSYEQLNDYEFKYKDAEKTTFTNKLRELGDEGREVNNWFKKYRIGEWNVGQNGFEYNPEEYETKKNKAIEVEQLAKKYNKAIGDVDDIDVDDAGYERDLDNENDMEYNIQGIRGEDEDEYEDGYAEDLYDDYENSNNEFEE